MEIFIMDNGHLIKYMVKEYLKATLNFNMMENGKMIYNMVMVLKFSLMELNILVLFFYLYLGEYKFGKKQGKGKINFSDGACYEGDFMDNNL